MIKESHLQHEKTYKGKNCVKGHVAQDNLTPHPYSRVYISSLHRRRCNTRCIRIHQECSYLFLRWNGKNAADNRCRTLRLRDIFNKEKQQGAGLSYNVKAIYILGVLLITVVSLTLLCIIVPLAFSTSSQTLKGAGPYFLYFCAIGFGFMLVEISQMQRLIIFLGHPTYGLSVVLFALLLSSGLGSFTTQRLPGPGLRGSALLRWVVLIGIIALFGLLTPYITTEFRGSITPVRILGAILILFPLGLFMGMAFPIGMKLASARSELLTPWLWGINGATSVCASVLAVVIALFTSISTSFWLGFGCYLVALVMFIQVSRKSA